jgi:cytochrome c biogenesis protein CcdA
MFTTLPVLIPILLADVINPVLLAAVIYALGGRKPVLLATMVLMGWMVVYFGSGIVLAIGLESLVDFIENPRPIDFYIEIGVAILLIWFGIKNLIPTNKPRAKKEFDDSGSLTVFGAFGIGATINLIGMPFAIPYFAALDQILKADMGWTESLLALLIYNLAYIFPFALLIAIKIIMGQKGDGILQKVNQWMDRIGKVLLPGMMILLGVALIIDAFMYFTTGTPWF